MDRLSQYKFAAIKVKSLDELRGRGERDSLASGTTPVAMTTMTQHHHQLPQEVHIEVSPKKVKPSVTVMVSDRGTNDEGMRNEASLRERLIKRNEKESASMKASSTVPSFEFKAVLQDTVSRLNATESADQNGGVVNHGHKDSDVGVFQRGGLLFQSYRNSSSIFSPTYQPDSAESAVETSSAQQEFKISLTDGGDSNKSPPEELNRQKRVTMDSNQHEVPEAKKVHVYTCYVWYNTTVAVYVYFNFHAHTHTAKDFKHTEKATNRYQIQPRLLHQDSGSDQS